MHRTRIKICGMMRVEDARLASEAGADAIGMIFHPPARRNIDVERARAIVGALGPFVTPVGVFVDAGMERVVEMAREVGIRVVQLHGNEPAEQVAELGRYGLKVIKAIRVDEGLERELEGWRGKMGMVKGVLLGVVLETGGTSGGSGVANDFEAIAKARAAGGFEGLGAVIVAGGLTVGNVGEVVRKVRPWGVDVSSGVEGEFGEKDEGKVRGFVAGVSGADGAGA